MWRGGAVQCLHTQVAEGTSENYDGPSNELAITITNLTFLKLFLKPLST